MKSLLCFMFCAFCFADSFSQNTPIQITIYSGDSVTQVNQQTSTGTKGKGSDAGLYKNLIKWNYFLLGRGVVMLNYERHIANNVTFEMGIGFTYQDFIFTSFYELQNLSIKGYTPVNSTGAYGSGTVSKNLLRNPFENSTKGAGFAVEVSPKFYFEKDEFEGFYVSPYLSYRKYNYGLVQDQNNGMGGIVEHAYDDLYYSFVDAGAKFGYQYYFQSNDQVYYDFYVGFAYRMANVNTLLHTYDSSTGQDTYSEFVQSFGLPQAMIGAKIGYAF